MSETTSPSKRPRASGDGARTGDADASTLSPRRVPGFPATAVGSAVFLTLLLLTSCTTRSTGPPTFVGPAGPESVECARTVLEPRGWAVRPVQGNAYGLDAERRETAEGALAALDLIRVRILDVEGSRRLEAVPRSYNFGRRAPADAGPDPSREVEPPEEVSRTAALVVATCQAEAGGR